MHAMPNDPSPLPAVTELPPARPLPPEQVSFIAALSDEERMLILLKAELYDGLWDPMVRDLEDRLHGRPFIFKLASRISDDLDRIKKLRNFEQQHQLDLATLVPLDAVGVA